MKPRWKLEWTISDKSLFFVTQTSSLFLRSQECGKGLFLLGSELEFVPLFTRIRKRSILAWFWPQLGQDGESRSRPYFSCFLFTTQQLPVFLTYTIVDSVRKTRNKSGICLTGRLTYLDNGNQQNQARTHSCSLFLLPPRTRLCSYKDWDCNNPLEENRRKSTTLWLISIYHLLHGAFSHDVTTAILVFQNNETDAMLV